MATELPGGDPYRQAPIETLQVRERAKMTEAVVRSLQGAIALLWLSTPYVGPRMNYLVCAEGLGIGSTYEPGKPIPWLEEALDAMETP